ncbi:hypothetical protein ABVT39_018482 [Epinephelus coioides]
MGSNSSESRKRSSKECGVSFKSDGSKDDEYLKKKRSFATASVRRKDSQGCTADVKDTPPSPKEKPDDLIGPDIDPVGDHDDLMATGSTESFDTGVSLKSDRSKAEPIDFKDRVSLRLADFSSSEEEDVSNDEDLGSRDDPGSGMKTS